MSDSKASAWASESASGFVAALAALVIVAAAIVAAPARAEEDSAPPAAADKKASFTVTSRLGVTIPQGAGSVRIWLAMPQKDGASRIEKLETKVDVAALQPVPGQAPAVQIGHDSAGNEIGYVEMSRPGNGEVVIVQQFELTRSEVASALDPASTHALSAKDKSEHEADLKPQTYIPSDATLKKLVGQIVGSEKNPLTAARKIYAWMLANIEYWGKDPELYQPSPMGSAIFCLSTHSGDSADFSSLFVALARVAGIPSRVVYGSLLKQPLDGAKQDAGIHSWAEMWLPGLQWQSADVTLGDLYSGDGAVSDKSKELLRSATPLGTYGNDAAVAERYFGGLDDRRVVWSRGRDLTLEPHQGDMAVNALPKAYVEIDGREFGGWTRITSYKEVVP